MRSEQEIRERARPRGLRRGSGPPRRPTPIPVSPRGLAIVSFVVLVVLALALYAAPGVLVVALGGTGLAIVLSFPVRALSRWMPRGLAILATFLSLVGALVLALVFLVPLLIEQLSELIAITPVIARSLIRLSQDLLQPLGDLDLLPDTPEAIAARFGEDLFDRIQTLAEGLLSGLVGFISGVVSAAILLFGVIFVAAYLLVDVRKVKAFYLKTAPRRYRWDARELWESFGVSLSRYLGGLAFVITIQGVLAGIAFWALGVPYAPLLGAWVSVTAIIPYLGAFLGAIPAVILAFFESPTTGFLALLVYILIQQLESNLLTPRIQGRALLVHPIVVLLAVIAGGQIAGLAGVIFAVPALAVMRVFVDFFRTRLQPTPSVGPGG